MRAIPADTAEMVSQVLFGETFKLIDKRGDNWLCIQTDHDSYVGWVDSKMITLLSEAEHESHRLSRHRTMEVCHPVSMGDHSLPLVMGSVMPAYDGIAARILRESYIYNGQVVDSGILTKPQDWIVKLAMKYLHAPYLWGGRTPFGVDCSGLTQVVCSMVGHDLPRDAKDQVSHGSVVDFVELATPGDLAFFDNEEGRITHVGIMLGDGKILHASGQVRVDNIDHYGIYVKNRRKYSHKLRVVKRLYD